MAKLTRQQLIDHLVGNCECEQDAPLFNAESDMETLEGMSDEQLQVMVNGLAANASTEDDDDTEDDSEDVENMDEEDDMEYEDEEDEEEAPAPKAKGKFPFMKKKVANEHTFNEEDLPEEIREDLAFARNMKQQQKDQLVAKITSNENVLFTKKELQSKTVDELTKIASLVGNTDRRGSSVPQRRMNPRVGGNGTAVNNSEENEILDLPVMDYTDN